MRDSSRQACAALPLLMVWVALGGGAARAQWCWVEAEAVRVRAAGLAELAGEIALRCVGGPARAAEEDFTAVVELEEDAALANRHDGSAERSVSEAALTVLHDGVEALRAGGRIDDEGRLEFTFENPATARDARVEMRITGVRVNAAAHGGREIEARVRFGDYLLLTGNTVVVAYPDAGLRADAEDAPAALLQCAAEGESETLEVELREGFAGAFGAGGEATQGVRFLLEFEDMPAGAAVSAPRAVEECASAGLSLRMVEGADAFGAGGVLSAGEDEEEVALSAGRGRVVYEVTRQDGAAVESCVVPLTFAVRRGAGDEPAATGVGRLRAGFAPVSGVAGADAEAPVPRFAASGAVAVDGEEGEALRIARCATTLLFPFATNRVGFGTGIVISNTSQDAFGTERQAGACTIDYYGSGAGGGAAPRAQTSTAIAAGGQLLFTLSEGNQMQAIAPTPEFQGYLIARCGFRYAHGVAFFTDGFGSVPTLMYGYPALVLPFVPGTAPRSHRPSGLSH